MVSNLKDLANKLDLSVTTVSRALNGHPSVSPKTVKRVLNATEKYGYAPSSSARSLKSGKTHAIGFIFPPYRGDTPPSLLSEFVIALTEALDRVGYTLIVGVSHAVSSATPSWQKMINNRQVDAVILSRLETDDSRVRWLEARGVPFVVYGNPEGEVSYPWLDMDHYSACRQGVEHLLSRGFSRIVFLAGNPKLMLVQQRIQGYREGMSTAGLPTHSHFIGYVKMDESGGLSGLNAFLAQIEMPFAILCSNDSQAFGVIRGVKERGLRVGIDVGVIGYDDIPWSEYSEPRLTTFHQPIRAIANGLVQKILVLLGASPLPVDMVPSNSLGDTSNLWHAQIVIRESCGSSHRDPLA